MTTNNGFKQEFLAANVIREVKLPILKNSGPRYIWRVTARLGDEKLLDLLFDATDIEVGKTIFRSIEYHPGYANLIRAAAPVFIAADIGPAKEIFEWFSKQKLSKPPTSYRWQEE